MSLMKSPDNESSALRNSIMIYNETQDYSFQDGGPDANSRDIDTDRFLGLTYGVLQEEGVIENAPGPLYMAVWMVDDYYIAELNEQFMNHAGPTDVLSFPVDGRPDTISRHDIIPWVLGDVFICPRQAEINAREHGLGRDDEIALLLVHGMLHLLGMDHELDAEAEVMETLEQELLRKFWYTPFISPPTYQPRPHRPPPHRPPPHQPPPHQPPTYQPRPHRP